MKNPTGPSKRFLRGRAGPAHRVPWRRTPALAVWLVVLWSALTGTTAMAAEGAGAQASEAAEAGPAAGPDEAAEPQVADGETAAADQEGGAGEAETAGEAEAAGDDEVFVPTEEISEDFAVSFPVDI